MFIAAQFTIAKIQKQPKCPSTEEQIKMRLYRQIDRQIDRQTDRQWNLLSIKNKILPFAAKWMDLEFIILSEVSQTKKDNYYISFICGI